MPITDSPLPLGLGHKNNNDDVIEWPPPSLQNIIRVALKGGHFTPWDGFERRSLLSERRNKRQHERVREVRQERRN